VINVLAVSGSLRAGSAHTGLIRLAQRLAPAGTTVSDPYPIADLPFYDSDLDTPEREPAAIRAWRQAITAADAVLFAAPEYNFGPTGVMKNAYDWAVRPMGAHVMVGKPFAVIGGGGKGGGTKVQTYFEVTALLGARMVNEPVIAIPMIPTKVSVDGAVTEPEIEDLVRARLVNLIAEVEAARS
jgi:chromate reductase, NAD(P)H dehydrogenase (quinone)